MSRYISTVAGPNYVLFLLLILRLHSSSAFVPSGHEHQIGSLNSSINLTSRSTIDASDEAILRDIDRKHNNDANQLCSYLASESIKSAGDEILPKFDTATAYHSPPNPILSDEAISALRTTTQRYFEKRRSESNDSEAWGMEMVDLDELHAELDVSWKKDLDDALTQNIYPLIRSGWSSSHDALSGNDQQVLTVSSATLVTGWGCPGGKAALTPLERDAGLFVVHIDLGNDGQDKVANTFSSEEDTPVMGALYLESLISTDSVGERNNEPIVGPLKPGQMVVHRSNERTAAIVVPSDIHSLEQKNKSSLDTVSRRRILKAAEANRHYALRLVLTIKTESNDETDIPEAPSEERSYQLRQLSSLLDSRTRYLTLASQLVEDDGENHLSLGVDYLSKLSPDNQLGSYIDKAVFHLEKAAVLCPTDARVHFQLATALMAKMESAKRLRMEDGSDYEDLESAYLRRARDALERSVQLRSAAVRVCADGIDDLAISLHKLAATLSKMGEYEEALSVIDKWAECGSLRSALAIEDTNHEQESPIPSFKWIQTQGDYGTNPNSNILNRRDIALTTVGDVRVFEPEDISLLRAAADKHFARNAGQTSRYTMQYEGKFIKITFNIVCLSSLSNNNSLQFVHFFSLGNSEVHLDDLCSADPNLKRRIDQILQQKVYPLVRAAFREDEDEPEPKGSICVYDSIFVRYDAEKAKAAGRIGASQPLVRMHVHV